MRQVVCQAICACRGFSLRFQRTPRTLPSLPCQFSRPRAILFWCSKKWQSSSKVECRAKSFVPPAAESLFLFFCAMPVCFPVFPVCVVEEREERIRGEEEERRDAARRLLQVTIMPSAPPRRLLKSSPPAQQNIPALHTPWNAHQRCLMSGGYCHTTGVPVLAPCLFSVSAPPPAWQDTAQEMSHAIVITTITTTTTPKQARVTQRQNMPLNCRSAHGYHHQMPAGVRSRR